MLAFLFVLVSSLFSVLFGSVWQINLAIRQLSGARKYSPSYRELGLMMLTFEFDVNTRSVKMNPRVKWSKVG